MAVNLSPVGGVAAQFFTNGGAPLTGGKIFTYAAGTTTPQAAYTTSQGNVLWTNPIVLDAAGRVPNGGEIWLTDGLIYKFVLKDANDVLIATYDNISGINSNVDAQQVSYDPPFTGSVPTNVEAKLAQTVSVMDFGAVGDGVADDTAAIQAAITASANKELTFPAGTYLVTAMLNVVNSMTICGGSAKITFNFPVGTSNANGALFEVKASDVEFNGLTIDATGVTGTITGANRYAIRVEPSGATRYSNISINDCRFTNLTQYSGTIPATTTVMHAIYARQVDDLRVQDCVFDTISGSCVFLVDTERAKIVGNDCIKFGWSGIWLNNANLYWEISGNTFSGTTAANPSYWGGAIDVMGQTSDAVLPGEPDQFGVITNNRFDGGVYRYGSVLRLASSRNVVISDNVFNKCQADQNATPGAGPVGSNNEIITLSVRDVTLNNGPHKNITISGNTFIAIGTGYQRAICARTSSQSPAVNTTACEGLIIDGNQFVCPDASNYFLQCVAVHGLAAGYQDITITNNVMKAVTYATPNYIIGSFPGAITLLATSPATVNGVVVEGNNIEYFNGTGSTNNHVGLNVFDTVTKLIVQNNVFKNFARAIIVSAANTGDILLPLNNVYTQPGGAPNPVSWRGDNFRPAYSATVSIRKTATEQVISSTTLQNDDELKFPINANEEWHAEFFLDVGGALAATGLQLAVTTPAGAAQEICFSLIPDTITAANEIAKRTTTSGAAMDWTIAKQAGVLNAQAVGNVWVANGATAGMVTLQFAQSTSSGTAVALRRGSSLVAERIL